MTPADLNALVERLRAWSENDANPEWFSGDVLSAVLSDCAEAATLIASQAEEIARLRAKLDTEVTVCKHRGVMIDELDKRALAAEAALADAVAERDARDGEWACVVQRLEDAIVVLSGEKTALLGALEPFAATAEHDIGSDETDADIFQQAQHNRAPKITVGHFRHARSLATKEKD